MDPLYVVVGVMQFIIPVLIGLEIYTGNQFSEWLNIALLVIYVLCPLLNLLIYFFDHYKVEKID